MVYHFKVHREKNGFWADCVELDGCHTQAATKEELQKNAREALELYLDEPADSEVIFALPRPCRGSDIMEVPVDPRVGLSVILRDLRRRNGNTQRQVAEKLGMRDLYSYQRLEKKANPSLKTLQRLKSVFPELSVDELLRE